MAEEEELLEDLFEKLLSAQVHDRIEDSAGNQYAVFLAKNGCRFITPEGDRILMEQNKNKDSRFARMAREGRKLGWVIPKEGGRWRLVVIKVKE